MPYTIGSDALYVACTLQDPAAYRQGAGKAAGGTAACAGAQESVVPSLPPFVTYPSKKKTSAPSAAAMLERWEGRGRTHLVFSPSTLVSRIRAG